jgi:hypothetical protein
MAAAKKRPNRRFVGIPYHVSDSHQFCLLSAHARNLLFDLSHQRTGSNNGALSACWTLMRQRGWKSRGTLHRAFKELQEKGFVVVTRQGMKIRGRPTLCALTWDGIDETKVLYDTGIKPSPVPLNTWKTDKLY